MLEKELQNLLDELDKKIFEMVGEKTDGELLKILQQWSEYERLENELKQIFKISETDNKEKIQKIDMKNIDDENAELILSLTKLKDKIQKNVQTNR